jgi:photosystem II stability/assembly factor-like uncharacterized protein
MTGRRHIISRSEVLMVLRRLLVIALLSCGAALDAAVDPSLFQDLRWRMIGPFRGGRVLAVSGVPGEPEHFYFGSVNGGVWETNDAGRTWQPIFDSQPIGSIGALALAPSNPKIIYVGSGESDMRSDISQGDGMYKSIDGGKTWAHMGLADSQQIARILVHPTDPRTVYVAALGHPYGPNAERGVFRSRDGGKSWQRILGKDDDTGAIDLAFEPGNPSVIYAAAWQTRRTPWSVYPPSNGPGSGLFKSTDGGDSWTQLTNGLPKGLPKKVGRIGVAVARTQPQRVYAIVDSEGEGGMYRSDDAGATWTRTSADTRIWSRGWYFGEITVEPDNADVVYSCNVNLYRSADGGKTFVPIKGAPGGDDYHVLWIDPQSPERRILGVDQGTLVSVNGGRTWSSWYNQPTAQLYRVVTDNRFPYWVYGSQQDSGAAGVPSRTTTIDGITLSEFREVTAGGESDNLAPDPKDPQILYGGRVDKLDLRTMQTQSVDPTIAYPGSYRTTWTLPLVFSRRDPKVLYFSHQRVFRTEDGGSHWSVISPDLTRENPPDPPNLDPLSAANKARPGQRQGVVYAIAPSRLADHDIWVGTDDGSIWRTRDEGANWKNITPPALTPWSKVGIIDTSHFDAETAYAAVDRHRLDDLKPYVYRTHDGGKSWTLAADGIGACVNSVREDPVRKGLLYAGTEKGVYVSFDDGDHWQPLQMSLPVTSVRDIEVHENDLVIATHGRSFWIMDNVTPLRSVAAGFSRPFLFPPATAYRERPAGFVGTPRPKDEALAPNPPLGAMIDYLVAPGGAKQIDLEILDAAGKTVRGYSSKDPLPAPDPARLRTAAEWLVTPPALQTSPGMHRFVWPLRYAAPAGLSAGRRAGDGVWAPPGKYSVALTIDGQRLTQPLTVVRDPRIKMTPEQFAAQFALAKKVEALRAELAAALAEADKMKSTAAIVGGAGGFGGPEPPLNTLRWLEGALQRLAGVVDDADALPTHDARAGYATLKASVEKALREWNKDAGRK